MLALVRRVAAMRPFPYRETGENSFHEQIEPIACFRRERLAQGWPPAAWRSPEPIPSVTRPPDRTSIVVTILPSWPAGQLRRGRRHRQEPDPFRLSDDELEGRVRLEVDAHRAADDRMQPDMVDYGVSCQNRRPRRYGTTVRSVGRSRSAPPGQVMIGKRRPTCHDLGATVSEVEPRAFGPVG